MLEIVPMRSNLPGVLTVQTGVVIHPWSAKGLRSAFRLIQAVARDRYLQRGMSTSALEQGLSQPIRRHESL